MLHETISIDPKLFWEKYTSIHVDGQTDRLLLRKDRLADLSDFLVCLARAYKTSQRQYQNWREKVWYPLFNEELQSLAVNDVVKFHAKPTHNYKYWTDRNCDWWEYTLRKGEPAYGWTYSFDWIKEPKEKLHHELGQKFYHLDQYQRKFSRRSYILKTVLQQSLLDFLYKKYSYAWLQENQFNEKLIKIELLGDEYWFRINRNKNGVPIWENFIWQNNTVETIKI